MLLIFFFHLLRNLLVYFAFFCNLNIAISVEFCFNYDWQKTSTFAFEKLNEFEKHTLQSTLHNIRLGVVYIAVQRNVIVICQLHAFKEVTHKLIDL